MAIMASKITTARLFLQKLPLANNKGNSKALHCWPLVRAIHQWLFLMTKFSNAKSFSMPWRHPAVMVLRPWASYQIRKICGLRMRREWRERFLRHRHQTKPLVSDPGMHHGTCVTHVSWCMSGYLTRGSGENVSRHSRRMCNPQIYVSGKRPMS